MDGNKAARGLANTVAVKSKVGTVPPDEGDAPSPLLKELMRRFDGGRQVVFDLGPASEPNLAFFRELPCRLCIGDMVGELADLGGLESPTEEELDSAVAGCFPPPSSEPYDIVLCWDVLNYLSRDALKVFMKRLAALSRPGALVHALIVASPKQMPERPGIYHIQSEERIRRVGDAEWTRAAPRYTQLDFERLFTRFAVERAMLLRSGMQEYLFKVI